MYGLNKYPEDDGKDDYSYRTTKFAKRLYRARTEPVVLIEKIEKQFFGTFVRSFYGSLGRTFLLSAVFDIEVDQELMIPRSFATGFAPMQWNRVEPCVQSTVS